MPEHLRVFGPPRYTEFSVITAALDEITGLDADPNSPIYEIADTDTAALTGHSLGSAVSLYAVGRVFDPFLGTGQPLPESIKTAALFAASSIPPAPAPSYPTPINSSDISVALLQGTQDGKVTPEDAVDTYENLDLPLRALIEFEGLNHFGITNDNTIPGTKQDPNPQTVDQQEGIERLALWTGLWLNAELRDSPLAEALLFGLGGSFDGSVSVISG